MAPINIVIKTLKKTDYPVTIDSDATISDLKELGTQTLNLGTLENIVYKGLPLKDNTKTLESLGIKDGTVLIGVFKKVSPASAESKPIPSTESTPSAPKQDTVSASVPHVNPLVPVTPGPVATPIISTPPPPQAVPAVASSAPLPKVVVPPKPDFLNYEWQCSVCTYINVPARTVCEVCDTPDPKRRLPTVTAASSSGHAGLGDRNGVYASIDPAQLEGMDKESAAAIYQMLMEDEQEAQEPHGVAFTPTLVEEFVELSKTDPNIRKQLAAQASVAEDASDEVLREALLKLSESHQSSMNDDDSIIPSLANVDEGTILSLIAHSPALQQQLSEALSGPGAPDLLRNLQTIVEKNGGEFHEEEDDGEDMEDQDDVNPNLEFDSDYW